MGEQVPASSVRDACTLPLVPAGFWVRVIAGIIDLSILIIPFAVFVSFLAAGMGISNPFFNHRSGAPLSQTLSKSGPDFLVLCIAFFALEGWLYFGFSESSGWRATLGKRLLSVYVADLTGGPVDFWRASLRFCFGRLLVHVPVLGGYYFLFDCAYVGLTSRKRAIHDLLSGCQVLRESSSNVRIR